MNTVQTNYGIFRQKDGTETNISRWAPEGDPNNYAHLANLLCNNWTKDKDYCIVANGALFPGFNSKMLETFNSVTLCNTIIEPGNYVADLVCLLFDVEKSYFSLIKSLSYLKETGTLFVRTLREELDYSKKYLNEGLSQLVSQYWVANEIHSFNKSHPIDGEFYIHEVYDIGNFRDYIIKYRQTKKKVCVGMIVKNEERDLPKLLQSLDGVADGICLFDTGSTDKTLEVLGQNLPISKQRKGRGGKVDLHVQTYTEASTQDEKGEWKLWDFAKARNQYVQKIEELGYDYVLWMDADDQVITPELLALLPLFDQFVVHGITMDTGNGSGWIHHRMWKTGKGIKYEGRCHEYPTIGAWTCQLHPKITVKHDAAPIEGTEDSNERNLRILLKAAKEEPTSRIHFYLANTYKDRSDYTNAVYWYNKRIQDGYCYFDEYVFAKLYMARCLRAIGEIEMAEEALLDGYHETRWAEFSMELAYLYRDQVRYTEAAEWCLKAIQDWKHNPPATALWREVNKYTDQPYRVLTWCYKQLGFLKMAGYYGNRVFQFVENDESWENFTNEIHRLEPKRKRKVIGFNRPGAIGDILMVASALQQYRNENPDDLILFSCHPSLIPMVEPLLLQAGVDLMQHEGDNFPAEEWKNLIGYPVHEGYPDKPMKRHIVEYFAEEMGVKGKVTGLKLLQPPAARTDKYITIQPQALWSPYKNWGMAKWAKVVESTGGIPVVQLGAKDDMMVAGCKSYLGYGFNTALNLLAHATFHLGVDSWANHGTNIEWVGKGKTPGLILWGSTQVKAAGYVQNSNISKGLPCQPCFKEDPKISNASRGPCEFNHKCMTSITVDEVISEFHQAYLRT